MWTREQEAVIKNRNSNLLVAAAAGSGKTAVLIERIIQLILDKENPVDIDKLLVVTFTNAAASEMRERVALAIEKALEEDPTNSHLQKQSILLNKAQITTIDSFCVNIVRENFHVTDLDPNVKMADPTEIKIMAAEILNELFEELYEEDDEEFLTLVDSYSGRTNDDSLLNLILTVNDFINSSPYPEKWLDQSAQHFNPQGKDDAFYITNYLLPLAENAHIALSNYREMMADYTSQLKGYEKLEKYYEEKSYKYEKLREISEAVGQAVSIGASLNLAKEEKNQISEKFNEIWKQILDLIAKSEAKSFPTFRKSKSFSQEELLVYEDLKPEFDKLKKLLAQEYKKLDVSLPMIKKENELAYPYMRAISNICKKFREKFAQKKKYLGLVDFADIEHYALKILTKEEEGKILPSDIALNYRKSYFEVFTDEYQDSNLVQEIILSMLAREDCPNRFMVGDVKQSIYRFRQAMPEIFMEKYESYDFYRERQDSLNKKIMLYKNFRSRAELLEACNHVFSNIMRKETGELDYTEEERLNPGAEFEILSQEDAYVGGQVEVYLLDTKEEEKSKDVDEIDDEIEDLEGFSKECIAIANIIYKMVNPEKDQKKYSVYDKNIKAYRPVEYRDIVILMRSLGKKALSLEEILSYYNIPVYSNSGDGYFSTLEVDTIINLLKVIDNPIQDIALMSVMRSPIFNFTASDLARIRLVDREAKFYEAMLKLAFLEDPREKVSQEDTDHGQVFFEEGPLPEDKSDKIIMSEDIKKLQAKIRSFIREIDELREKSLLMSVDEFIWYLLKKTGYYDYVAMLEMGEQRQNNLMLLFERARSYEKTSYKGLFNFINYVERMKSRDTDLAEAKSISQEANVVRIMSIHKSKGLEFPVVIVANIDKSFNMMADESNLSLHQTLGYGPKIFDKERKVSFNSRARMRIDEKKSRELIAEEMRILYVAMTRAKEKLIFTGRIKDRDKTVDKWKATPKNASLNTDTLSVLTAKSYLNWIMPTIVNLNKLEEAINVRGEEVEVVGYKDCKWSINYDKFSDIKSDYHRILSKIEKKALIEEDKASLEEIEGRSSQEDREAKKEILTDLDPDLDSFSEIKEYLDKKFNSRYKYHASLNKPSSLSVSEIKRLMRQDSIDEAKNKNIYEAASCKIDKIPKFMHTGDKKLAFSPAEKGTIFHLVMQLLDFLRFEGLEDDLIIEEQIKSELARLLSLNILTEEEAETVNVFWIKRFIKSSIFKEILDAQKHDRLYKEKAINYSLKMNSIYKDEDIDNQETIMMVGIVDLFFEDREGNLVLLDYKTDFVANGDYDKIIKRYKVQLSMYKQAIEKISGKKIAQNYLYMFASGKLLDLKNEI